MDQQHWGHRELRLPHYELLGHPYPSLSPQAAQSPKTTWLAGAGEGFRRLSACAPCRPHRVCDGVGLSLGLVSGSSASEDPMQVPSLAKNASAAKDPVLPRNVLSERERSGSSASEDPMQVPSLAKNASAAKDPVLPRNVLSERERRKRISASCERLRALLPSFDGRREDMASVLEMAVQFLRLAHSLGPGWEQHRPCPKKLRIHLSVWEHGARSIEGHVAHVAGGRYAVDPDEPGFSRRVRPRDSGIRPDSVSGPVAHLSGCVAAGSQTRSLACLRKGWPGQAGPLDRAATSPARLAREVALMPALDIRSVSGLDVEVGECFPLSASPEWWPGPVEARGATPSGAPARSSPVDRAEPGFLDDPVPSPQEPQDGPLELWGSDMDSWGLDLQDDSVDGIFADFLGC
ncbi:Spermatogenesis- and oogenesis-specific basic helix-loop-helix-containing protein 1 [Heterocephalus glaber]|uniref:Spermatogenesis-and oogenesis-specific basic helix-loop-helix-containing protein 1 n=1 Tax=Heterocephalus glaber TaxID=10181 RepID=G5BQR5_HETGA|nr:Spermatogenesis- and oogenesis-specific basic helix-loop-helix-containing protein 1 [Heterocephalus glaber]